MSKPIEIHKSGGIGIAGLLTVIFVCAKIFELGTIATWSWWWVFSPLWISFGFFILFALISLGIYLIINGLD